MSKPIILNSRLTHAFETMALQSMDTDSSIDKPHFCLFLFQSVHLERKMLCSDPFKQAGSVPGNEWQPMQCGVLSHTCNLLWQGKDELIDVATCT